MPIYEYECDAGHLFEVTQKMSDPPLRACQVCELPVSKLISSSGIAFKGAGWYVTDYSDKMKPSATEEKPAAEAGAKKDGTEKPAAPAGAPAAPATPAPANGSSGSSSTPAPASTQ